MPRALVRFGIRTIDRALAPFAPRRTAPGPEAPAIFLIGAPRSGSTLVYQALVHARHFAYLTNLSGRFPRSAAVVSRAMWLHRWSPGDSFTSEYGDTEGLAGPSEAGDFWDHVFPWDEHHTVAATEVDPTRAAHARATVHALVRQYRAPFLCKNLWHSVRLEAIDAIFPEALFLVLQRDACANAQSMLAGRRRALGDASGLWSIRPRELVEMGELPELEQVAHQLAFTHRAIERARVRLGAHRFLDVPYEAFCAAPSRAISRIDAFLEGHGLRVRPRDPLPASFAGSSALRLSPEEIARLESIWSETWPSRYRVPQKRCTPE